MLVYEKPWTRQPQRAVQPRAGDEIPLLWSAVDGAGTNTKIVTRKGIARVFGTLGAFDATITRFPPSAFKFLAVVEPTAASDFPMILAGQVAASDVVELRLNGTTGRPEFVVKPPGGGYLTATGSTSIVGSGPVTLLGTYDPAGVVQLWQDGVLVASASGAGGAVAWGGTSWRIGARALGGLPGPFPFIGNILLAAGMYGASNAQSESANPWQIFAPRQIYVPMAGAVPTLPTLSASTFVPGSVTSTGWRPRVTATY